MSINEFPAKFGKYILLDRLNAGGMAEVFRAKVTGVEGFERLVAIKCMLPALLNDEQFSNMFIDEARLAAQVGHANVAQIYELGRHAERLYIAMELVSGRDLRHIIKTANAAGKHLPPEFAAYVCSKAAEGLDFAHRKVGNDGKPLGLVHRDISPQNILVSYDGEVKVVDFGIAKANDAARDTQTQVGVLKGKFAYMSPEQVLGHDIDRRADIFALGSVLYEMVTGNRLFTGESDLTVLERVREGMLPDLDIVLPAGASRLIPVFQQALQVDPAQRFGWASEMAEALEPMLMGERNIFGPKRAAALMREMYATEVADLAAKLKQFASVNEANCLVTIGESDTDPGRAQRVFESTFANKAPRRGEDADTGVVPSARLGGDASADGTTANTAQAAKTTPQRPSPRPAAVQPKVVVPRPAPRLEVHKLATTPITADSSRATATATATQLARTAGPTEPTAVPSRAPRPATPFEPTQAAAPASAAAPPVRSTFVTPVQAAPSPPPPRGPASQAQARSRSDVNSTVTGTHRVMRRLKVVMGVAVAVTGGLVLIVNASMPTPVTLSGSVDQLLDLHPVSFAEQALGKARDARVFDRWLFGNDRAELPRVTTTSRYAPSNGAGAAASEAPQTPLVVPDAPGAVADPCVADAASAGFMRITVLGAENAHVLVDGTDLGAAPLPPLQLRRGNHTVRIERRRPDGYVEHRESHVRIDAQHSASEPMLLTLTF